MNFSDIALSGNTAIGIGSSVQLTFTFPEIRNETDETNFDENFQQKVVPPENKNETNA